MDTDKKELEFNSVAFFDYSEGATKEYTVEDKHRSKYMKVDFSVTGGVNRYTPDTKLIIKIKYWNKNASGVYEDGATQSITITPTKNSDSVTLRIYANYIKSIEVSSSGTISSMQLFLSKDLLDNQLVEVTKAETLYATVVQSKVSWTSSLIVDRIETNLQSIVYKGNIADYVPPTDVTTSLREFIVLKDRTLSFRESTIDLTQFEDLKIEVDGVETQVNWSAIRDHEDAYKYFTLVPPEEVFEGITPEEAEQYKVKVFKTISTVEKLKIEFEEQTDADGHKGYVPIMTLGAGNDTTGQTDYGKGKIYKGLDSLEVKYVDKDNDEIGLSIDEVAPRVINKSVQGLHNNIILDHEPTDNDIEVYKIKENDIIFVV